MVDLNCVVQSDLDSVVLSGWTLCGHWSGRTIHFVLYSLVVVNNLVLYRAARSLIVKSVSASAFVPASYYHHWDPFGTSIVLLSR